MDLTIDATEAKMEMAALEQHAAITLEGVMKTISTSYMAFSLFLDIFHTTLPMTLQLAATASLMIGSMFVDLATAQAAAGITGVMAIKAGITLMAAAMMFNRAMILEQQASETEQSINSMIHLLDLMTR
ncbi:MAG: hypothetical protein HeimC3_40840 [Candidatus Heimdallarchaeota archaeon LC_3]|nr:MAG: hypothetical protein HeimC3_40840 [Candidatus Heimdallarchaeota archaeon LC_3]